MSGKITDKKYPQQIFAADTFLIIYNVGRDKGRKVDFIDGLRYNREKLLVFLISRNFNAFHRQYVKGIEIFDLKY